MFIEPKVYTALNHRPGLESRVGVAQLGQIAGPGTINTAVLIGSSLTMALALWAAKTGRRKSTVAFLVSTLVLGSTFLGIKAIEYSHKFHQHLVPGPHFEWEGPLAGGAQMFFNLYFLLTGLHALHMVVGAGLLIATAILAWRGRFSPQNHNFVEGVGLY